MASKWDQFKVVEKKQTTTPTKWDQYKVEKKEPKKQAKEDSESFLKSSLRTGLQIPMGIMEFAKQNLGLEAIKMASQGMAYSGYEDIEKNRIEELKRKFPNAPWDQYNPITKEKYDELVDKAASTFPTVGNIAKGLEATTGIPLEAKTPFQRLLRLMSGGASVSSGSIGQKIHSGLKTGAYASALRESGVPESVADLFGLLASHFKFPSLKRKGTKSLKTKPKEVISETPPPGGDGTPSGEPFFKNLVPEHEILERIEPLFAEELSKKIREIGEKPKFAKIEPPIPIKPPKHSEGDLERSIGTKISKARMPSPEAGSKATRRIINEGASKDYKKIQDLYERAELASKTDYDTRPKMLSELEDLASDISLAEEPSTVQKDIRKIANKYIKLGGDSAKGYQEISNAQLIAQIKSNNQKINHDYVQGRPSNAYLRLNKILGNEVSSSANKFPESVALYDQARNSYRDYAKAYGNDQILPWRDPSVVTHTKLIKKIENADELAFLKDILSRTPKGKTVYNAIRRDFIEKKFRPYIKDPLKIDSLEFDDLMREIKPVTTPQERASIEHDLLKAQEHYIDYERYSKAYEVAKQNHADLLKKQKEEITDWKNKVNKIEKDFPYKTDSSILKDLTSVRGLKRIEKYLPKTDAGKKMLNQIKDYSSVNLLTQGKINPSDSAESLKKILNDVNKKALLEHTLGKQATNDLHLIVNNMPKIDKRFESMKGGFKIARTAGRLIPGVRGYVSTAESLYDIYRMFRPAAIKGNFKTIDMDIIKEIIENREELLK